MILMSDIKKSEAFQGPGTKKHWMMKL